MADRENLSLLGGRRQEVGWLVDGWKQAQHGSGHVALLCGEAGIGKSRLVMVLREEVGRFPHTWLEGCGPAYHISIRPCIR